MLTSGKASILDKVVVLCKFHRGLDNTTFADRFNFEVYEQLVEYFGTDNYESWDLKLCHVPITLTRTKTNYKHRGYLDVDAIQAIQNYLNFRYAQTGRKMQLGKPLFLNKLLEPITISWISDLIPKLARNAGIQKKMNGSELISKNEKTSHELRDLLKSTLIVNGVAPYVCELAIGHKVGDSYEKQDLLYPNKSREEFMKASEQINIFSNCTNYLKEGTKIKELEEKNKQQMITVFENKNGFIESMEKKMSELTKEIQELKNNQK